MFSYEEMIDISKKYRFKLDFSTKQFSVINKDTGEKLGNSEETDKIKGLLYAHQTMMLYKQDLPKEMSEEEKSQVLANEFKKLQESLVQIGLNGEYTITNEMLSGMKGHNPTEKFLKDSIPRFDPYTNQYDNNFEKEGYKYQAAIHFMNSLLAERGKKVRNIENLNKTNEVSTKYKLEVENQSFKEQLNPNNPVYNKSQSKTQLSPDQKAKRREFVENLMKTYLAIETDKMYDERVENENSNMQFAVKNSQNIDVKSINIPKIMRLLLAAKNVSLYDQKDYLEEIISQSSMNQALLTIKNSTEYTMMINKRKNVENSGKLVNGKPKGHCETIGERDARIANNLLKKNPRAIIVAMQKLSLGRSLKFNDEKNAIIYSAVARSLGKTPSYKVDNDGIFKFDYGEEISR